MPGSLSRKTFDRLLQSASDRQRQLSAGITPVRKSTAKPKKTRRRKRGFDWGVTLACLGIAMGIIITFLPPQSRLSMVMWVSVMFGVLVYPGLHFGEKLQWIKPPWIRSLAAVFLLVLGVMVFTYRMWPPLRRHIFSESERNSFEKPLINQKASRETIELFCAFADENTCIYAGQFIDLFREAGWTVKDNAVQRIVLAKPIAGVILFEQGEGKLDPSNWRSGLWTAYTSSLENVRQAFVNVEIEPDGGANPNVQKDVIDVYFGSEKENAAERTSLTKMAEQVKQWRGKGVIPSQLP